jgi:hypothetical protein
VLLAFVVWTTLAPDELDVHTDIVGYPTFANFNVDRYFWMYGLVALVPLAFVALYAILTRVFHGRGPPRRPLAPPRLGIESLPVPTGWQVPAVAAARTLFVGGVLGLEVAIWLGEASEVVLATCLAYAAAVFIANWLLRPMVRCSWVESASLLNTLATPFLVAGLWGVSKSTNVTITSTGAHHGYPWLPAWLAFGAAGALFALLAWKSRQRRGHVGALERRAIVLVAAPVAIFMLAAQLPDELGSFDAFEDGQALAGATLVRDGAFPWRDILVSHGLLHDVGRGILGFQVFEDSRWGLLAADGVLLVPLTLVGVYYLCVYLLGANWLVLTGTQLIVLTGLVPAISVRMLLVPIAVLLLGALLQRPTTARAVAFTLVVVAQALVTPEAIVVAAAVGLSLGAFEFAYRERGLPFRKSYRRTLVCLATLGVLVVGWSLFLAVFGALDDWASSFAAMIPGHRLTGGVEMQVAKTSLYVLAPVVVTPVVVAVVTARVRLRRPLAYQDWLMIAMAMYSFVYFTKFLSRADRYHLDQSLAIALPLLCYVAYRALTAGESLIATVGPSRAGWLPRRHLLTLPMLVALVIVAPKPLADVARGAGGHFRAEASRGPEVERIGYARAGENDTELLELLEGSLASLLEPGETMFDFSNAPGVFHYLFDEPLATPYYHVSYAIRQRTQSDLVQRLRARPPGVIVLTSPVAKSQGFNSAPSWDAVVNEVRHYDVAEYLHDQYVPVRDVGGYVLMARRDRARAVEDLYFREDCDWGHVPDFFAPAPPRGAAATSLPYEPLGRSQRTGRFDYAVSLPADATRYRWLEIVGERPIEEGYFHLADRRDLALDAPRAIFFKTRGDGATSIRVRVGACSQWRGYRSGTLYLSTSRDLGGREIRLVDRG